MCNAIVFCLIRNFSGFTKYRYHECQVLWSFNNWIDFWSRQRWDFSDTVENHFNSISREFSISSRCCSDWNLTLWTLDSHENALSIFDCHQTTRIQVRFFFKMWTETDPSHRSKMKILKSCCLFIPSPSHMHWTQMDKLYTVKLTRAKLSANSGNFTCGLHVKRPHMQFACVTWSLPVKTAKFTCVYAASTSRRIHANCLQAHVNLPEYHGHFTCGTHAICLPLVCKSACFCRQKYTQLHTKIPAIAGKNTRNYTQNYPQLQAKIPVNADKITRNCRQKYP